MLALTHVSGRYSGRDIEREAREIFPRHRCAPRLRPDRGAVPGAGRPGARAAGGAPAPARRGDAERGDGGGVRRASFEERARVYDRLRPQDDAWWQRFEALVEHGDLRGQRVLDVGCGTGTLATALAERALARVWGVEPSEAMRAVARGRVPRGVGLKAGSAEALPFRDGWFDRVVMCLVVHLVDRPRALEEARRVLAPAGRVAIATFTHAHFERYWAAPFFPSLAEIDRARFPDVTALGEELAAGGFDAPRSLPVVVHGELTRDEALARLRGRHISTFDLLEPAEVEEGIARAERDLPARVATVLDQAVVVADRS